jgi:hypothetical protein
MSEPAVGIISMGLGGDATAMILGSFHLGFASIEIIDEPDVVEGSGAGASTDTKKKQITIRVTRGKNVWARTYIVDEKQKSIIIKVGKLINTMVKHISITVGKIKKIASMFKIRIKK